MHRCHANNCEEDASDVFCNYHLSKLPSVHIEKMHRIAPLDCGICNPGSAMYEWFELANLGIAILCLLEYGDHDCPKEYQDEGEFCWACGIYYPEKTFAQAKRIAKRFNLR
jgi:hypothetical protein